jgi:hypothetical protein
MPADAPLRVLDQLVEDGESSLNRGRRFNVVAVGRCELSEEGRDAGVIPHAAITQDLNRVLDWTAEPKR